ncbi:VPS10 domain-containing receptor SorCS2 [Thelohanellus kitauei]|uniref:VPS10 domain-containing receptor SorCS2 n=1 Tax=Thelohanellus kitauei TaxID=669202 RepID=A0A0C2JZS8_THEKT|nr:VPS10 domain-containing receptor SorCS2 [Thelohanellus kitauei]
MILGIWPIPDSKEITTKIIRHKYLYVRPEFTIFNNLRLYSFVHGNHYILAGNNATTICLCALNKKDQLVSLACNLSIYDKQDEKCSYVINPHLFGVIYVNLKDKDSKIRTYISLNNGKNFRPFKLEDESSKCQNSDCHVELDLKCSSDYIKNNFPEKWIVIFRGTYQREGVYRRHTFLSFDGGRTWKILDFNIDKLLVLNHGGLLLAAESKTGIIWYSYDDGLNWYSKNLRAYNFIVMKPLEYPNNLIVAAINYQQQKNIDSSFFINFSSVISSLYLITDSSCQNDDFEAWHTPRYYGSCFQGQILSYLKKKSTALCVDNRNFILPSIQTCPCSLEDFQWYHRINLSEPNYYFKNNLCTLDKLSTFTQRAKICRDGGIALNELDGY